MAVGDDELWEFTPETENELQSFDIDPSVAIPSFSGLNDAVAKQRQGNAPAKATPLVKSPKRSAAAPKNKPTGVHATPSGDSGFWASAWNDDSLDALNASGGDSTKVAAVARNSTTKGSAKAGRKSAVEKKRGGRDTTNMSSLIGEAPPMPPLRQEKGSASAWFSPPAESGEGMKDSSPKKENSPKRSPVRGGTVKQSGAAGVAVKKLEKRDGEMSKREGSTVEARSPAPPRDPKPVVARPSRPSSSAGSGGSVRDDHPAPDMDVYKSMNSDDYPGPSVSVAGSPAPIEGLPPPFTAQSVGGHTTVSQVELKAMDPAALTVRAAGEILASVIMHSGNLALKDLATSLKTQNSDLVRSAAMKLQDSFKKLLVDVGEVMTTSPSEILDIAGWEQSLLTDAQHRDAQRLASASASQFSGPFGVAARARETTDNVVAAQLRVHELENELRRVHEEERIKSQMEVGKVQAQMQWLYQDAQQQVARTTERLAVVEAEKERLQRTLQKKEYDFDMRRGEVEHFKKVVDDIMLRISDIERSHTHHLLGPEVGGIKEAFYGMLNQHEILLEDVEDIGLGGMGGHKSRPRKAKQDGSLTSRRGSAPKSRAAPMRSIPATHRGAARASQRVKVVSGGPSQRVQASRPAWMGTDMAAKPSPRKRGLGDPRPNRVPVHLRYKESHSAVGAGTRAPARQRYPPNDSAPVSSLKLRSAEDVAMSNMMKAEDRVKASVRYLSTFGE